ncbi:MAG: hypothetical protein U9Q22_01085 [Candidatus Altiarchaeota archaeon]|nr:hypothetical protein [Candidatus Altiarchaeota archaeon]
MTLAHTLKESFKLLFKKPKVFIPNMSVALIYAVFELILIKLSIDLLNKFTYASPNELIDLLFSNLILMAGILVFYPLLGAADLITYAMYPSLVSDYHGGRDISLRRALKSSLAAWRIWLTLGLVLLMFVIFVTPIVAIPVVISVYTGHIVFLFIAFFIFIATVILLMMAIFFVIPIGVIESETPLESFKKSYRLGFRHKKEVFSLTAISIIIILIAITFGSISGIGLGEGITYLAVSLFLLIRLIQSVIYTYISVVNPYFYCRIKHMPYPAVQNPNLPEANWAQKFA